MNRFWLGFAAAAAIAAGGGKASAATLETGAVVRIETGEVRGEATAAYRRFQAMPYAAPPVGDLRWRSPRPAARWSGVRDATQPSPACLQPPGGTSAKRLSEDCLYLDVVAPVAAAKGYLRPVLVWIYGGGFSTGAAMDYDSRRLAVEGDLVVVTLNYRLGALGFFGMPGLAGSGEFALQDQQAALRWVQRNIAAFGGDPANVTLAGESAGAMSTCAQLVSPQAKGLFQKGIMQSGSCIQGWPKSMIWPGAEAFEQFVPLATLQVDGAAAAAKLGCQGPDALTCLKALPGEAVLKGLPFSRPAYGGPLLPLKPAQALADGRIHRVPLIWGATHDEWRSSAGIYAKMTPFTPELYRTLLRDAFGARADQVEAVYSASAYGSPAYAWAAASTDNAWACPTLTSVRLARRRVPVFQYQFADADAPNPAYPLAPDFKLGAGHATELAYLFDLGGRPAAMRPDQKALASAMVRYWAAFAATGRPQVRGLPAWPEVTGDEERRALSLAPGVDAIRPVDIWTNHHCDLWATVTGGG